ncbi:uncharacterized protein LOC115122697 isoform X1 [Oncorhynchus nerka]|uniref:uncharacterized protein LOC115122697 isoform X1 n=1 Tax=Oncorhynchus nerka TaxID=8023 RepID=UPI0031B87C97
MAGSFFGKVIIPLLAYFLVEVTGEQQYGGLGREITLTPKVSGQPEDILWKHNGNKVVEFDRSQNVEYGSYKGRTILDWDSGALTIKGLTDADSGPYELEAVVKGKLQYSQHKVGVIDDVAQPSATCVVDTTTPENMDRTLLCSADLQPLTQFIWRSPEGSESPGPELFIPGGENQDSENQESIYTCVVKNPVSEKSAEFTLKNCYTEEGSSSVLAVVLSILLLLVLVAVVAFLLWYYWRKCKKPAEAAPTKSEEEKGLVAYTKQGNNDPEDDHSENTGNITSIPKGMVKEQVELINKQNADPSRKWQTGPAGRIFSPTKSRGHSLLYRQNDSLSDKQTVTDTEHVQDNWTNPGQQDLVTPDHTQAQQDLVTPDPTPAQQDLVTPDPTPAQQDLVTEDPTPAQQDLVTADPTPAQQDLVTPDPTPAQQDLVTPDPTPAQQDLVTPDPTPAQQDLVTPDPTPAQQDLVTEDPTPAQQDLVTPDPTPAQQDLVTPDPTPAQQDLVTADPTPAQQDLVTPDPTPAQQDLVTADPTPAQQDLVTEDPTPAQQDLVTEDPTPAQQDLVTADPTPAQQDLVTEDPPLPNKP